jgi:hypothetical protein
MTHDENDVSPPPRIMLAIAYWIATVAMPDTGLGPKLRDHVEAAEVHFPDATNEDVRFALGLVFTRLGYVLAKGRSN